MCKIIIISNIRIILHTWKIPCTVLINLSENNHRTLLAFSVPKLQAAHWEGLKSEETLFGWNFLFVAFSHECCFHFNANQSSAWELVQSSGARLPVFLLVLALVSTNWCPGPEMKWQSTDCAELWLLCEMFKFLLISKCFIIKHMDEFLVILNGEPLCMFCLGFLPFLKKGKAGWYVLLPEIRVSGFGFEWQALKKSFMK